MAHHCVIVCCWKYGHETELSLTKRQEESLSKKVDKLKAVCPICRDSGNGNQPIFIKEGRTLFSPSKVYQCHNGHITLIGVFGSGKLHIKFGFKDDDFINIDAALEELENMIDKEDILCYHIDCGSCLKAKDDFILSTPESCHFRTKTRVGDVWDKAGLEPVRHGHYDRNSNYQSTKTEQANKERLRRMRERNTPAEKHPGRRIDKATNTDYGRRSKNEINPERLRGPQ